MEFWNWTVSDATRSREFARKAEALGWDGIGAGDSQSLTGDPYVFLALAATVTEHLKLATSVTNPVTRHAAATASSAFALQSLSGGRMSVGIGRGDSALAHLGRAPARLRWFERYVEQLQAYLSGDPVPFDEFGIPDEAAPPATRLALADAPATSTIRWADDLPKVNIEIAATGPRVIEIAARHADRVMLAVGANPERIAWGINIARKAAQAAGRDVGSISFGAYVNVTCHPDVAEGRELGRGSTGLFARFSSMYGEVAGPANDDEKDVFRRLHKRYDMNAHGHQGGKQTTVLTDEFMNGYAIVGSAHHCVERLLELSELGIEKFGVIGPDFVAQTPDALAASDRFISEVAPALRRTQK
ncbi:MAG: LLM class flavin-dependent oxidoreductase [Gammaproteobacteria bacterium]|nr:LLM class flavin-dependent oxidoreductase [Gammaproteobacteria bacterium]